jgi:RNA-directed DNA polymerase
MATIIAQIACHENELPQGSPCSPVISNLVGHLLDARLARLAKTHKCTYSRYVDDITFSTSRKDFPPELAVPGPGSKFEWQLGAELRDKIEHSGFKLNEKKTRMQFRGSRQVTTGLTVNEKVNIREEYWRAARHMCQALFTTGTYYRMVPAPLAGGALGDPPIQEDITSLDPIGGMLAHIHQVKDHADQRKSALKRGSLMRLASCTFASCSTKISWRWTHLSSSQRERPIPFICGPPFDNYRLIIPVSARSLVANLKARSGS